MLKKVNMTPASRQHLPEIITMHKYSPTVL